MGSESLSAIFYFVKILSAKYNFSAEGAMMDEAKHSTPSEL
jgi:hypothetical protein